MLAESAPLTHDMAALARRSAADGGAEPATISLAVRNLEAAVARVPGGEEPLQRPRGSDRFGDEAIVRDVPAAAAPLLRNVDDVAATVGVTGFPVLSMAVTGFPVQLPLSNPDHRSHEEIERTRVLHRPGPSLGLDDLPALREGLGRQGTLEQRDRARSYGPGLAQTETQLLTYLSLALASGDTQSRQSLDALDALRATARDIQERAEEDYENSNIMGVDYESIMQQLGILFRRVDDVQVPLEPAAALGQRSPGEIEHDE
jgi:hypothetical protein